MRLAICIWLLLASTVRSQCVPQWLPDFSHGETNAEVLALATLDAGSGPALFVAGGFTEAGGIAASRVAKWTGSAWSYFSGGPDGPVHAVAIYDTGSGPAVVVGGNFENAAGVPARNLAWYRDGSWHAFPTSPNTTVRSLAVYNDGSGPRLYVGGDFSTIGPVATGCIARWDGSAWSSAGEPASGQALAMTVYLGSQGPVLAVGGSVFWKTGPTFRYLGFWDGQAWSRPGPATDGPNSQVRALTVAGMPGSQHLYVAGATSIGSGASGPVGFWNGAAWTPLASQGTGTATALAFHDKKLYVCGLSSSVCDVVNGQALTPAAISPWQLSGGPVNTLAVFNEGAGPALFAGGTNLGLLAPRNLARLSPGPAWTAPGRGAYRAVDALARFTDASGPSVYAGGLFTSIGQQPAVGLARWNGQAWSVVPGGLRGSSVACLEVLDWGLGPRLIAGGDLFSDPNNVTVTQGIVAFDGTEWSTFGSGLGTVRSVAVFDDGAGRALYAAGLLSQGVAKWTGSTWMALGPPGTTTVHALVALPPTGGKGTGRLIAAGAFSSIGGVPASRIAQWNGTGWSPLGTGLNNIVRDLLLFDDGSGPALLACGDFTMAGSVPVNRVAKWNGQWSNFGQGLAGPVYSIASRTEQGAPVLYASSDDGSVTVSRWQGGSWSTIGALPDIFPVSRSTVIAIDGPLEGVYVGGAFNSASGVSAGSIARWGCPLPTSCLANCDLSTQLPLLTPNDFLCFINKYALQDPAANCDGSTGTPLLTPNDFTCFINAYAAGCP